MSLLEKLREIGLPPKEAAVYLALLELGTASVQAIARRADLVRPTAYVILEHLIKKGLVSKATGPDAKKMLFVAEDPGRLKRYLDQRQQELERRREDLDQLVPELRSSFAQGEEKPRVRLFEGKEGLKQLQVEFVAAGREPIVGMTLQDEVGSLFTPEEFFRDIVSVRIRAGVPSRHISVSVRPPPPKTAEEAARMRRETRYLPFSVLPLRSSFAVHGHMLSVVSLRGKILGVLIEHPDIADSFRAIFEVFWKMAQSSPPSPPLAAPPTLDKGP